VAAPGRPGHGSLHGRSSRTEIRAESSPAVRRRGRRPSYQHRVTESGVDDGAVTIERVQGFHAESIKRAERARSSCSPTLHARWALRRGRFIDSLRFGAPAYTDRTRTGLRPLRALAKSQSERIRELRFENLRS